MIEARIVNVLNVIISKGKDTAFGRASEICLERQNEQEAIAHIIELAKCARCNFYKRKWGREVALELHRICQLHGVAIFDVEEQIMVDCILYLKDQTNQ